MLHCVAVQVQNSVLSKAANPLLNGIFMQYYLKCSIFKKSAAGLAINNSRSHVRSDSV